MVSDISDSSSPGTHQLDAFRRAAALSSPTQDVSRTQQVYAALRYDIIRTHLAPGQVVTEPELATRFAVSKTPVREALQILVVEGLVTRLPRRGYLIRPLGIREVREVLDLRMIIEPPLAAAAARFGGAELVDELGELFDIQQHSQGTTALTDSARAFHERVLQGSRNARAQSLMSGLFDETTRAHYLLPAIDERIHSEVEVDGHRHVLEAIAAHDPEEAQQAMAQHLQELRTSVLEAFLEQ